MARDAWLCSNSLSSFVPCRMDWRRKRLRRQADGVIALADRARDLREWPLAAHLYCEALEKNPHNPPIWVQYGHALKESGQLANAEVAYRRAIADAPSVADSHLQLGQVLKMQGKTEEAAAAYVRAFKLEPTLGHPLAELSELGWSEAKLLQLARQIMPCGASGQPEADRAYNHAPWMLRRKMLRSEITFTKNILSGLGWSPRFSILIGLDQDNYRSLDATLDSLKDQAYSQWRALIVCRDRALQQQLTRRLTTEFFELNQRAGIAAVEDVGPNFTDAIARASSDKQSDLIGIISAGDVLGCDALLQMALSTGLHPEADFIYTDERRISPISGIVEAFLKPQWSPDLLLATNYIGRLWCAKPNLINRIANWLENWRRFGEYDLVLRCTEAAHSVRHVPYVLCERGAPQIDDSMHERKALALAMQRHGIAGKIAEGCAPGYYRLRRRPRFRGLVSIIIPAGGNVDLLRKCLSGLFKNTRYQNFELIILHNRSWKPEAFPYLRNIGRDPRVRIIDAKGPFNFSRICNLGAASSRGELLLFLNDDIEIIEPDWIDALIRQAKRPEVGIVGARLVYPNGTVEHAGMFWAAGARSGRHSFRHVAGSDPGYFGLAVTQRNVLAVTGACIMMRRSWFDAIGGFDETHTIVNNDVDICLRSWSRGGRVVYEPAATLLHHGAATRHNLPDEYNTEGFWKAWEPLLRSGDPYYHPLLSRERDDYAFDEEAVQWTSAANGGLADVLGAGWSAAEDWGVWGVGDRHEVNVHFPEPLVGDIVIDAEVHVLLGDANPSQSVDVFVGECKLAVWEFTRQMNRGVRTIRIAAQVAQTTGCPCVTLTFRPNCVVKPTDLDPATSDCRALGLALHRLRKRLTNTSL